jgi:hypothetical protein
MTATAIRQKLSNYIKTADEEKIKAIYTMVSDEINTEENEWDESFVKELNRRSKSFTNNTGKTYTWEETKQAAIKSHIDLEGF